VPVRRLTSYARSVIIRIVVLLTATIALALVATAPAPGKARTSVSLSPKWVAAGKTLTVKGRGWPARKQIVLLVGPPRSEASPVATVKTGRRGRFVRKVQISALAKPGRYVLLACRRDCAKKRKVRFTITPR